MGLIGNITIGTKIQTTALAAGLKKSAGLVDGFVSKIGGMGTAIAAAGAAIGSALAVNTIKDWTLDGLAAVDTLNDMSIQLGITTEKLGALQFAASMSGASAEELNNVMQKMNLNLGKGDAKVVKTLEDMGLNLTDLKHQNPDQAFAKIVEGIGKIENPADRAAASVALFGKQGVKMAQLIEGGSGNLTALTEEFKALGLEIDGFSAGQAADAQDSLDKIGLVAGSLKNKLAVELAPVITAVATSFLEWTKGIDIGKTIQNVVRGIAKACAYTADAARMIYSAFKFVQSGVTKFIADMVGNIGMFAKAIDKIAGLAGFETDLSGTTDAIKKDLDKLAKEQLNKGVELFNQKTNASAVDDFFNEVDRKAAESAEKSAQVQVDARARAEAAAAAEHEAAAVAAAKKEADAASKERKKQMDHFAKEQKRINDELENSAESIFGATRTPLEEFEAKLKEIQGILDAGGFDKFGGIETAQRAADAATKEYNDSLKPKTQADMSGKFAGALTGGSAAARSAILAYSRPAGKEKDQLEESKKQTVLQKQIRDKPPVVFEIVASLI